MKKRLFPILIFTVTACSNGVNAPSLMPRAVEKQDTTTPPTPVPINSPPANPALQQQIDALLAKVKAGDEVFSTTDRANGRMITAGRGAAEGSEAWVVGQQAQSALEAARQDSAAALAEIETLLLAQTQAAAGDPATGGVAELTAAEVEASAIVARQTGRLKELTR
jgi:Meckel syndrome type 1 protein